MDAFVSGNLNKIIKISDYMRSEYAWTSNDLVRHFTALIFVINNKEFKENEFSELDSFIKENTGAFSHYRSYEKFVIMAVLLCKFKNPKETFLQLLKLEDNLKREGFHKGLYLSLTACELMDSAKDGTNTIHIERFTAIYRVMKENHYWLTGQEDYPIAGLMSATDKSIDKLSKEIEAYYKALNKAGLWKDNGLQLLSHILSFNPDFIDKKVSGCVEILDYLKERKVKVPHSLYGLVGLVYMLEQDYHEIIDEIEELIGVLKKTKGFKWELFDSNLIIACALIFNKYVAKMKQNKELVETSIGISLEMLIAAENAMIVACCTAATIAATSSTN